MEEQINDSTENLISFDDEESPDPLESITDLPGSLPPLKMDHVHAAISSSVKYSDYNHKGSIGWITCHVHCTSVVK